MGVLMSDRDGEIIPTTIDGYSSNKPSSCHRPDLVPLTDLITFLSNAWRGWQGWRVAKKFQAYVDLDF